MRILEILMVFSLLSDCIDSCFSICWLILLVEKFKKTLSSSLQILPKLDTSNLFRLTPRYDEVTLNLPFSNYLMLTNLFRCCFYDDHTTQFKPKGFWDLNNLASDAFLPCFTLIMVRFFVSQENWIDCRSSANCLDWLRLLRIRITEMIR